MNNLTDTLLNIEIFAFIGLMVRLYIMPVDIKIDATESNGNKPDNTETCS